MADLYSYWKVITLVAGPSFGNALASSAIVIRENSVQVSRYTTGLSFCNAAMLNNLMTVRNLEQFHAGLGYDVAHHSEEPLPQALFPRAASL